jgi:hypothetical protein
MERCDHCGRMIGTEGGDGHAAVGEMTLCHPQDGSGRPNCFKLVTKYGHLPSCALCKIAWQTAGAR